MTEQNAPFACDMTAIAAEQRGSHLATIEQVFASVEKILELADGYSFQLPNESEMLRTVTEFITLEKLCCPFFRFRVEVASEGGPVYLRLTGREGVKPFIIAEISAHLPAHLKMDSAEPNQTPASRM